MAGSIIALVLGLVPLPAAAGAPQVYEDAPFRQERAVHFVNEVKLADYDLRGVRADRDGKVLIHTQRGLLKAHDGRLVAYRELAGVEKLDHYDLELLKGKFVFLNEKMLLPLHGAGADYRPNDQARYQRVAPMGPGHYLLLSPTRLTEINGTKEDTADNPGFTEVVADPAGKSFVLYGPERIARWEHGRVADLPKPPAGRITGAWPLPDGSIAVATDQGLWIIDGRGSSITPDPRALPWKQLTCVTADSAGRLWLGSTRGAFRFDPGGGRASYYAGRRWLPDDRVIDVHVDTHDDVYVLTAGGLSKLDFEPMTLADKAAVYLANLRRHHIRYGLVSDVILLNNDYAHARLHDTDNDGLWSAMYLAAEAFRYAVTQADDARENLLDGFDAMERLVTITGIPGFEARSFELHGHKVSDPDRWRQRPQRDWEWKGHTSSDELVGSFFFFSVFHETAARHDPALKKRCADLVGAIVNHIIDHRLYLVDVDGKPTLWGRWNPEYVNTEEVGGDRRLNSIEILSFLQLAFALTGEARFKETFYELVNRHGYADNTVRYLPDPMGEWNHSDDELYWLSYYNLLRHCFDEKLRPVFLQSAREHARATARKRNPLWNFIRGAGTGDEIDLEGAAFILREFPLDTRNFRMHNSHRQDVKIDARPGVPPEAVPVLPPDERPIHKWNGNEMILDGGGDGNGPESGAEFLLPYWMGRYHGYISAPK
ncbi:MAG: hypothetical protein HRF43_18940 [Phycisphaerae bacterium]|jgi:hypothetical protein